VWGVAFKVKRVKAAQNKEVGRSSGSLRSPSKDVDHTLGSTERNCRVSIPCRWTIPGRLDHFPLKRWMVEKFQNLKFDQKKSNIFKESYDSISWDEKS
jgi:hypothetical protein